MRKVTRETVEAFYNGQEIKRGNSRVERVDVGGFVVYVYRLHGNAIAIYDPYKHSLEISHCNWTTPTTKERLNAILSEGFGYNVIAGLYYITQINFEWFICSGNNCKEWDYFRSFNNPLIGNCGYINDKDLDRGLIYNND